MVACRSKPSTAVNKVTGRLEQAVAALARWTYEAKGMEVLASPLSGQIPAVLILPLNRVEAVVADDFDAAIAALDKKRGDAVGEVWILTPLHAMGRAHDSFRGRVDRVVPWWIDGGSIKFG